MPRGLACRRSLSLHCLVHVGEDCVAVRRRSAAENGEPHHHHEDTRSAAQRHVAITRGLEIPHLALELLLVCVQLVGNLGESDDRSCHHDCQLPGAGSGATAARVGAHSPRAPLVPSTLRPIVALTWALHGNFGGRGITVLTPALQRGLDVAELPHLTATLVASRPLAPIFPGAIFWRARMIARLDRLITSRCLVER